jgi:ketosteroid isomerase-like protein
MPDPNVALIRQAYAAYARGDTAAVLDLIDPDLEWTYLDPSAANPHPQVCHGRGELAAALAQQAERGLRAQLEQVIRARRQGRRGRANPRCERSPRPPVQRP